MKIFLLLLLISLGGFIACDDKKEAASNNEQEISSERENSKEGTSDTDIESSKEELASKEEANQDQTSAENRQNDLGMTPGLPADFPSDVPTPKNSMTLGSLNSTEGTVVTFESNDKVTEIIEYYKEQMKNNGYEIVEGSENLVSDKGGVLSWKKNNKEVGLMLGYDKDKNITSLVITYK